MYLEEVFLKNPYSKIKNEIQSWLESKGYRINYCYGVIGISIVLFQKISDVNLNEFEKEFKCPLILKEVTFNRSGEKSQFKYNCYPSCLDDFSFHVSQWLNERTFPCYLCMCSDDILLNCYDELSEQQIRDFEKEFDVKCINYQISCGLDDVEYVFQ